MRTSIKSNKLEQHLEFENLGESYYSKSTLINNQTRKCICYKELKDCGNPAIIDKSDGVYSIYFEDGNVFSISFNYTVSMSHIDVTVLKILISAHSKFLNGYPKTNAKVLLDYLANYDVYHSSSKDIIAVDPNSIDNNIKSDILIMMSFNDMWYSLENLLHKNLSKIQLFFNDSMLNINFPNVILGMYEEGFSYLIDSEHFAFVLIKKTDTKSHVGYIVFPKKCLYSPVRKILSNNRCEKFDAKIKYNNRTDIYDFLSLTPESESFFEIYKISTDKICITVIYKEVLF